MMNNHGHSSNNKDDGVGTAAAEAAMNGSSSSNSSSNNSDSSGVLPITRKDDTTQEQQAAAVVATTSFVPPSLMDRDDDDGHVAADGGDYKDEKKLLYMDHVVGDAGRQRRNDNNDDQQHDWKSCERSQQETRNEDGALSSSSTVDAPFTSTTPSTTPTVEIIDESGCDHGGGTSGAAAEDDSGDVGHCAAAAAAATAGGSSSSSPGGCASTALPPPTAAFFSSWRRSQQHQQAQTAAAAAAVSALWNKHKTPTLEMGLKRMQAVVATTVATATSATTATTTTATSTTTAQPLESAKLESPLATTTIAAVTGDSVATAASSSTTVSTPVDDDVVNTGSVAENQQERNNNDGNASSKNGQDDEDGERRGGGDGAAAGAACSTDGGGAGGGDSRYSRSRSSSDDGSSYWSSSSSRTSSSSSDNGDGSSSAAAAARGNPNSSSHATTTPAATGVATNLRGTLKWAAVTSAVDSMQQSYRGRYNNSNAGQQQQQQPYQQNNRPTTTTAAALAAALVSGGLVARAPFPSNNNNNNASQQQQQQQQQQHPEDYSTSTATSTSDPAAATNNTNISHTQRLLHSRAHDHVAQLMKTSLQSPHEYLLLLGHGMLGVNLKPTFLAHRGVYVDYLVAGGAAHAAQVVYPGDLLCQIGHDLNVRHGGILEIPSQIAATKRPVHLVLSSGTDYYNDHHYHPHDPHQHAANSHANKTSHKKHHDTTGSIDKTCYITHVDLCAAILHVIMNPTKKVDDETNSEKVLPPSTESPDDDHVTSHEQEQQQSHGDDEKKQPEVEQQQQQQPSSDNQHNRSNRCSDQDSAKLPPPAVKGPEEKTDCSATPAFTANVVSAFENNCNNEYPATTTTTAAGKNKRQQESIFVIPNTIQQVNDLLHAQIPTRAVRRVWGQEAARRANHLQPQHVEEIWTMTTTGFTSETVGNNDWNNLQMALKHAFVLTILDGRRFPFLSRSWTQPALQQQAPSAAAAATAALQQPNHGSLAATSAVTAAASPMNAILLTLFLEMHTYCDLHGITPVDKLQHMVRSIAYKFFLPTSLGNCELVPPLFDFHHIVPDSSLRQLEQVLKQMKNSSANDNNGESSSRPPRNVFWDFQQAVLEILAGKPFLSFIITDECARMRAFLRETAPFLNVPLDQVWPHLVQSGGDCGDGVVTKKSEEDAKHAKNYFLYVLVYLLCQMDHEPFGEHGELPAANSGNENANNSNNSSATTKKHNRMEEAASAVCAAIFIQRRLLPSIHAVRRQTTVNANQDINDDHEKNLATLMSDYEQLWEIFLSPVVGVLHRALQSQETKARLRIVLDRLTDIQTFAQYERDVMKNDDGDVANVLISPALVDKLVDVKLAKDLTVLAQELVYYEYSTVNHSKFRAHKFHEWMCAESAKTFSTLDQPKTSGIPPLPVHCIKRLLRKAEFPQGVSSHKPAHHINTTTGDSTFATTAAASGQQGHDDPDASLIGAECAVVFGTDIGLDLVDSGEEDNPTLRRTDIRRYTCQSLRRRPKQEDDETGKGCSRICLTPQDVPEMVESYATVPPSRTLAFADYAKHSWKSRDGWEAALVNFMLPRAGAAQDGSDAPIYGVSLVLSRQPAMPDDAGLNEEDCIPAEFVEWSSSADDDTPTETFASPISFSAPSPATRTTTPIRRVRLSKQHPKFSARLAERSWRDQVTHEQQRQEAPANSTVTVGIALVSQRNVLISMRDTLSRLVHDFSRPPDGHAQHGNCLYSCAALVDVLGNCANPDMEPESLLCILEPYLHLSTKPWIERPIGDQERVFKQMAGEQLVKSLPPIPLALMFVTVLLEQKVVFSSSRRGLLLSATTALTELLKPLKWCHLIVPRVPSALALDLLQYPAPFILGLPSEDPGIVDLIQDLPDDVTLVDLDVGRVILAPNFAHNADIRKESTLADEVTTARAIRSQVLYLAQSLGTVFGSCMDPVTWSCDRVSAPLTTDVNADGQQQVGSFAATTPFNRLKTVCHDFLQELLAGTTSCCYWVEEATSSTSPTSTIEPTVIFDEDRFFRLKNQRFHHQQQQRHGNHWAAATSFQPLLRPPKDSTRLALSCDGWWMVMEILLRCQNMNDYIGTIERKEMMFYL
jgi:DENN (AEX-3) domain